MAVDYSAAQVCTNLVKLIAKIGHLVRAVLVAGDDFVDRINDDGNVIFLGSPANQLGRQLVHGHGLAAQVPDIYVGNIFGPLFFWEFPVLTSTARGSVL